MSIRPSELRILAVFLLRLVEYGTARGLDLDTLLRIAGRSPEQLREPGTYAPVQALFDIYAHVMRALDDPAVPFRIAEATSMEDLHVMGFAVITARDGRESIQRAVRYARLITNSTRWEHVERNDHVLIRLHRDLEPTLGLRAANEGALADFTSGTRQVIGIRFSPLRVRFRHRAPRSIRPHQEHFGCPVEFDAPYNELELPRSIYELGSQSANPALSEFFRRHAEELLCERETEDSLQARVRQEIAKQLPSGNLNLARVARHLAMSERSLRRYLTEEGASFSQLVAEVRYQQARTLLESPRLSLSEIAYLLGFSNVSAFSRAFKSWSGKAPGQYRSQPPGSSTGEMAE